MSDDILARARAALDGVDVHVIAAARALNRQQQQNPEWVWVQAVAKRPSMSFGRWQKNPLAAPYVRLDLALRMADELARLRAEVERLRDADRAARERAERIETTAKHVAYNVMHWRKAATLLRHALTPEASHD